MSGRPAIPAARGAEPPARITELLADVRAGRREALACVLPLVYQELRRVARRELWARPNDTLSATGLVHELYLKLLRVRSPDWRDRTHFLAAASVAMRHILVDRARRRAAEKRGGSRSVMTLDEHMPIASNDDAEALLNLHQALETLAALEPRLALVVEYRFFGAMSDQEIATVLGVTDRTVRRDVIKARGLLLRALELADPPECGPARRGRASELRTEDAA